MLKNNAGEIDSTNMTIVLLTDGEKTKGLGAKETIDKFKEKFTSKSQVLPKIITVGLCDYDEKELRVFAEQTERALYQ